MIEKKIIILVPFNIIEYSNINEEIEDDSIKKYFDHINNEKWDKKWIQNRINIFMNYTLKSFKSQTNQDFQTFVMYNDKTKDIIFDELEKYESLPSNVEFVGKGSIKDKICDNILECKFVYFVRIDSDDMYHSSYIQKLQDYKPRNDTVALLNKYGYLYDSVNNKMGKCCAKVSCYTLIFNAKDYLDGKTYNVVTDEMDTQMGIAWNYFQSEFVEGFNYIWHVHSTNTLTVFDTWFTDKWISELTEITTEPEKIQEVLSKYK